MDTFSTNVKRQSFSCYFWNSAKTGAQRLCAALPKRRSAHYIPVLREVLTGRYNQFGCGFHSIARDLFESA